MNRRRHTPIGASQEGTPFLERLFGGLVGAAAGALLAFTFNDQSWLLGNWYIGVGGVLGLLFGLSFASKLWDFAREQFELEMSGTWGLFWVLLCIVAVLFVVGASANAA